jgi:tetratricopeptide (TPR) repeat protein
MVGLSGKRGAVDLEREVGRALGALDLAGDTPAHDGWLDPHALVRAAGDTEAPLLVRVAERLGAGEGEYAPEPRDGAWLRIDGGARVRLAPLRASDTTGPVEREARAVRLSVEPSLCCDRVRCERNKHVASVWIDLAQGDPLLCAERVAGSAERARTAALAVAGALAARLRVAIAGEDGTGSTSEEPGPEGGRAPPAGVGAGDAQALSAASLARWSLRREGELFVLRDHTSRGPRDVALRETLFSVLLGVGTVVASVLFARSWPERSYERLALIGLVGVVLGIATYAMAEIARFSARYRARSAALLAIGRDRIVVSPWVSRDGAVTTQPEGRYGAALALGELHAFERAPARDAWRLGCDTVHGPYDIGDLATDTQARAWLRALEELARALEHAEDDAGRSLGTPAGGERRAPPPSGAALGAALGVVLAACGASAPAASSGVDRTPAPSVRAPFAPVVAAAPATAVGVAPPPAEVAPAPLPKRAPAFPFVEGDAASAVERARREGKAVLVDVWAPWCHTCLSMKSFVLPDPSLAPLGARVVGLALDSDRPESAAFLEPYEINVWPTLLLLDVKQPGAPVVLGMWPGAASARELVAFVTDTLDARDARLDPASALAALIEGKSAQARGRHGQAAAAYRRALERGGPGWPRRSEALFGALQTESRRGRWQTCADFATRHASDVQGAAVPTDFVYVGIECAQKLRDRARQAAALVALLGRLQRHTEEPPADASVDDRSDALALLAELQRALGDRSRARATLERQILLLERAAAEAPEPRAAAAFDYARMNAYLALGRGAEAVAMLQARTRELGDGYEPFARLAQALAALGRHREALAPIDRAIELSYGPRQLRYFSERARLLAHLREAAAERATLERLLAAHDALPDKQRRHPRQRELADEARKRLAALRKVTK